MIHKLSFKNFFSFKNEVTIDFTVDDKTPDTDDYIKDSNGIRVSKIMTVVGANASGKTNLLKSIGFLKWFIVDSFSGLNPKDNLTKGFKPFLFCSEKDISSFNITFEISDNIYEYRLDLKTEMVVTESLEMLNKETKHLNKIFARSFNEQTGEYDNNFTKLTVPSDFEKIVRKNSSVISAAKQIENPIAIKISEYFSRIQTNTDEMTKKNNDYASIFNVAKFFKQNPLLKEKAEKILRRFDLGLSTFSIQEVTDDNNIPYYIPVSHHKYIDGSKDGTLVMFEESGGTRNLFVLLKDILVALDTGDVVVFDELDNNLHALMIPEIINLFKSKKTNPKNAQILFSTHNVQILNELDKYQVMIVEKDENNISEAWKLSDVEGVRVDENYYAKYLAGVYGGIPKFE